VITCAKCGRENEDSFSFCQGCGANLAEQRAQAAQPQWPSHCPQCTAPVTPGQRFCGSCGYRIEPIVAAPVQAAPVASAPAPTPAPAPVAAPAPAPVAAQPAPLAGPRVARLIVKNPDGSPGFTHPLQMGDNRVGRSTAGEHFAQDLFLSPEHVSIRVEGNQMIVRDLGSLNGVYYRTTTPVVLQHGDTFRIGRELLRFQLLARCEPLVQAPAGTEIGGSNPHRAWGRLERMSAANEATIAFVLRAEKHTLGRERGDILFPDDGFVSGQHCTLSQAESGATLTDLGSSNGTFIRIPGEMRLPMDTELYFGASPYRVVAG
jgi:pSer/pThr/pTyr-binding forkhead associated (FHA) protein